MPIKLNGATNGSVELDVPAAVGSDLQITLPATAGTAIVKAADGSVDLGSVDIDSSGTIICADGASGVTTSANDVLTIEATDVTSKTRGLGIYGKSSITSTFEAFQLRHGGNQNITFKYDGSASFAGGAFAIASDGDISTNIRGHGHLELDSTGSFGSPKVKLFGNTGAATFAGTVTAGTETGTGTNVYASGSIQGIVSGAQKWYISPTGAATFASYNDSSSSGFGVNINVNANTGDVRTQTQSTASQYTQLYGAYFGSTRTFHVLANGNVQNTNNSYSQISDVKLKENIVDANSQWNDLKAVQVRNFNFKSETGHSTHTQIGVVAQEIETVSPGLVYETPDRDAEGKDLDTVTKAVSYSVLYMKAIKALQEAMTRIETLETKVAALEAAS